MKQKVVLSLGGSVFYPKQFRYKYIEKLGILLRTFENTQFLISCGGGYNARKRMLPEMTTTEKHLAGIAAVNENAQMIHDILSKYIPVHKDIIIHSEDTQSITKNCIIGADRPGHTSDFNAILVAKIVKAKKLINFSNINYMYDKNPKIYKSARPLKDIAWNTFFKIIGTKVVPGGNYPFDPLAAQVAKENNIVVQICNGNSLIQVKKTLNDEPIGSIIGKDN
jgi:uridylate kinase